MYDFLALKCTPLGQSQPSFSYKMSYDWLRAVHFHAKNVHVQGLDGTDDDKNSRARCQNDKKRNISMYRKHAITNQICVSEVPPCKCLCDGRNGKCAIQTIKQKFSQILRKKISA